MRQPMFYDGFVRWVRHLAGVSMFVVSGIVFLIPAIVASTVFAVVSVICIAVIAVGGILSGICFVPVVVLTPGGIASVRKAWIEETKK